MNKYVLKRRDIKVVVSGDIVEVFEYRIPISVEKRDYEIIRNSLENFEKRDNNLRRARSDIRRYIWQNITPYSKFITLTYAKTELDYNKLIDDFKLFIKNMKNNGYKDLKYLYVTEHQKERGKKEGNEGSLHIHCVLFYDDYIPFEVINKCWGKGGTDIHKIDDLDNVGAYVCKYLTKEEILLAEKNCYHISRGLKKPVEICHDGYISDPDFLKDVLDKINYYYVNSSDYSYTSCDGSTFNNSIIYKQGRLPKNVSIQTDD